MVKTRCLKLWLGLALALSLFDVVNGESNETIPTTAIPTEIEANLPNSTNTGNDTDASGVTDSPLPSSNSNKSDIIFAGVKRVLKLLTIQTELTTPLPWIEEAISIHNKLRKLHGSNELVLNTTLCQISQAWANSLAISEAKFVHNPNKGEIGENLYWTSNEMAVELNATIPVQKWYDEIKDYDYATTRGRNKKPVEHFTQVVWKGSKEIGLAYATTPSATNKMFTTYVVANYYPRGNYDEFSENVAPLLNAPKIEQKASGGFQNFFTYRPLFAVIAVNYILG